MCPFLDATPATVNPSGTAVVPRTVMTTFPRARPSVRYLIALGTSLSGYVLSTTGLTLPASIRSFRNSQERWVEDGKFITSAGVSAGIDMAMYLMSKPADEATARRVQLALDYDPQPPFGGIDWPNVPLPPRLVRGGIRLAAPLIAATPKRLTNAEMRGA